MARPKIEIDPKLVTKLAAIHCTTQEIAHVCECSVDTLERRFAAEMEKGRSQGKTQLRQGLWQLAAKGNLGALIWLSKQHLGMTEKTVLELSKVPDEVLIAEAERRIVNEPTK